MCHIPKEYKGYSLKAHVFSGNLYYVTVVSPTGEKWIEDTVEDAKHTIDDIIEMEENN